MLSRVWISSFVSVCAAATAPLIFEEMRLGCIERVMTERPDATIDIRNEVLTVRCDHTMNGTHGASPVVRPQE